MKRPFSFSNMSKKWLSNLFLSSLVALTLLVPFHSSQATTLDPKTVIALVNDERAKLDIQPLEINADLSKAALEKANDMVLHNYFAHVSPSGVTPWQWIGQSGYDYSFAGENLAINFTDAKVQHEAFMQSESHKKNILNPKYKEIGVAVITGKINGTQTIITVQEFGAKVAPVPIEKTIAGVSTTKKETPLTSSTFLQKTQQIFSASLSTLEKTFFNSTEQVFPTPLFGFLYTLMLWLVFIFFCYEILATYFHFAIQHFSLRKKPINLFSINSTAPISISSFYTKAYHPSRLERIYLTHMKLKK